MIRDRITQLITLFTRQIYVSRGSVLLGRETNAGEAQEIIIGDGLTLSAGTLSAEGGGGGSASVSDSEYNEGTWDAVTGYAPSKNAVRDKFVSVDAAIVAAQAASQPLDSDLTAIAALTTDAFGRVLLTKTTEQEAREYIGSEHFTRTTAEGVPTNGIPNYLETSFTGTNNDFRFEQLDTGTAPQITFFRSALPPAIIVSDQTITIQFSSSQTASQIKTLIEASAPATALVSVAFKTGNDGTGTNSGATGEVLALTSLSGGSAASPPPDHIGQLCRVGDAAPYDWYRADTLTSWVPVSITGSPVAWNATQSAWQKLIISGAPGSEQIAITTIS